MHELLCGRSTYADTHVMHDRLHDALSPPHGGTLVQPVVDEARAAALRDGSRDWPSWDLTPRQLCDLELLLNGACSPLAGFMARADYDSVCETMRLANGLLWPLPITLDVPAPVATRLGPGALLALRDQEGVMLAALHVEEVWQPDRRAEADAVFGTASPDHPEVDTLLNRANDWYVGGWIEGLQLPVHHDFAPRRLPPAAVRAHLREQGWARVVGYAPRTVLHREHVAAALRAMRELDAGLLLHAGAALAPADVDHYSRMRCYNAVMAQFPSGAAIMTLSSIATRLPAPREALWRAIVGKNFGSTHWMLGPADRDVPGGDSGGATSAVAVQDLLRRHQDELGVSMVPWPNMDYCDERGGYIPTHERRADAPRRQLSAADLHALLQRGQEIPDWFTFREVAGELRRTYRPRHQRGLTIFFTGLSGSGKSTLANALLVKLLEAGDRTVTLLDGDLVRKHLSSELGFSREHRTLNVRRIGFVASEVTRSGGVAICALIAPHEFSRHDVRQMIEPLGGFVLVHVATPLAVCEARDRKGLYAKARAGLVAEFTGISAPYEPPGDADLTIDTSTQSVAEAVGVIVEFLTTAGYLAPLTSGQPHPSR